MAVGVQAPLRAPLCRGARKTFRLGEYQIVASDLAS